MPFYFPQILMFTLGSFNRAVIIVSILREVNQDDAVKNHQKNDMLCLDMTF